MVVPRDVVAVDIYIARRYRDPFVRGNPGTILVLSSGGNNCVNVLNMKQGNDRYDSKVMKPWDAGQRLAKT